LLARTNQVHQSVALSLLIFPYTSSPLSEYDYVAISFEDIAYMVGWQMRGCVTASGRI
jgi:hypothetical protein